MQQRYCFCNLFQQFAKSGSCFFCSVTAHCTGNNIIHLVDLLLLDSIVHAVRVDHPDLDTISNILNRLLSLFYGRCCIQILVLSDSHIFLAVCLYCLIPIGHQCQQLKRNWHLPRKKIK